MTLLALYAVGVVVGLVIMRDRWPQRLFTAAAWPLGPAALVIVIAVLIPSAAYLWPVPVLGGALAIGLVFWLLS